MKVWTYYAHPSEVFPNQEDVQEMAKEFGSDTDILYAMTPDKHNAKVFRRTRNMDIFHEIVLDDLTDEEWNLLLSDNRDCYLEYKKIATRNSVKNKSYPEECVRVNMLLTFSEIVDIEDNTDINSIIMNHFAFMSPLGILQIPILKKLFKLHYWDIMNAMILNDGSFEDHLVSWTDMDAKLISMVDMANHRPIRIDQLEYFITHYGHTLAVK